MVKTSINGDLRPCELDKFDFDLFFCRYKENKYSGSEEQMKKYTLLLSAYGVGAGIDFKFHGQVANTLDAHRMIQHYQEELGSEKADTIVNCTMLPSKGPTDGETDGEQLYSDSISKKKGTLLPSIRFLPLQGTLKSMRRTPKHSSMPNRRICRPPRH